jgi:signal transduction histidine kinase/CheY-like chemotaxis protein/CHASE3 domain sensor protein
MSTNPGSITRRLQLVFAVSILLLLISSVASFYSLRQLIDNADMVNHTNIVLRESENVISRIKDAETGQRGYLLTRNPMFLKPYTGAYGEVKERLNKLKTLTVDNPEQQRNLRELEQTVNMRFDRFTATIEKATASASTQTMAVNETDMLKGKQHMDEIRSLIDRIQKIETDLLEKRNAELARSTSFTPILVIVAAIVAILITILSYIRIKADLDQRLEQQKIDEAKYIETSARITVMESVTKQLASGDYEARSADQGKDDLGKISFALNDMANNLQQSFNSLSDNNWLQTGMVKLNEATSGQRYIGPLSERILEVLTSYTGSPVSAMYVKGEQSTYILSASHAASGVPKTLEAGENILGEALKKNRISVIDKLPAGYLNIGSSLGNTNSNILLAIPLAYSGETLAIIELGFLRQPDKLVKQLLEQMREPIGVAINSALNFKKLEDLFERTQSQAEELKAQHSELENLNTELEAQAQKLQASEEELRVQQEELLQTNAELEERSRLLEEKNELITERNLEIQQKAEELALSTRYKSEFLANMSHELRTPLNSILLLSRLLAENNEKNLTEDQSEYARVIQSSGHGLLSLIDEILDLSKIEAGKMELEYEIAPVEEIGAGMRSLFAPIAKERKLDFNLVISEAAPKNLTTDRMRLEQVLKNLLSNSFKFTTAGSVALQIDGDGKDSVIFKVVDTGIGIPADKQSVIFEAFQQADGSTRRKFGGTGLGLSISRELVRLLGGNISLQSEPGKGTTFTVTMPVAHVDKPASPIFKSVALTASPGVEFKSSKPLVPLAEMLPAQIPDDREGLKPDDKMLLVVEDDLPFAKALLEYIRGKGYKGVVATRGDEGLDLAVRYKPLGILLDIQLPVKDGWEVMKELKENKDTRHIPVHIMSSLEAKKESLHKGAIDFISKPVAFEQMQEVLKKLELVRGKENRKVLIVEENAKHATALAYFLETTNVASEVKSNVADSVTALRQNGVDCVILDMGIPGRIAYDTLEAIKKEPGLENLPIIVFTGKSLSAPEEQRLRKYADSIVVKTAHSYQRILDEVSLFLHLVDEKVPRKEMVKKHGMLHDVLRGKKILIADDDVRNVFSLTKALETHEMDVMSAINGKEALEALRKNGGADIVLMDIMMPEMDGYEAIRAIRKDKLLSRLPVIAVTAKTMVGDREKCIQAGASDYISKPVDIDQLVSLLRVWLYQTNA